MSPPGPDIASNGEKLSAPASSAMKKTVVPE
jgi:hypothetical protein